MNKVKKFIARNFESFSFFYRYLRYRIFISIILSIAVGVLDGLGLSMFLPLLQLIGNNESVDPEELGNLRFLVDAMQETGLSLNLVTVLLFMVIFFTLKGILQFLSEAYRTIVQQYFMRTIRINLLDSLNNIRFKYFVTSDLGRIQNTMTGEIQRVMKGYQTYFRAFEQAILVLVYMGFAFFVDAQFAVLITVGGALTNLLYKAVYKKTKGASRKLTADSHAYEGQVMQHVGNFKYLKAAGSLDLYAQRMKRSIISIERSDRRIGILNGILIGAREPLLILVVAAVMIIQTRLLGQSLGPILISLLFFYRALTALMNVQNSWNNFISVSGSLENITDFQRELNREREVIGKTEFNTLTHGVVLKDVDFGYAEEKILHNISLEVSKNETLAFVGESGSGKTTLVNILAGLMPVDGGQMLIDGIHRSELNVRSYQKHIGYITQEPVIFSDSIFNNVTFWAEPNKENIKRFEAALRKAAIWNFVQSLPSGGDSLLGNNGVNLSGGQRQRISIARELYKDIDILIMDEATSALDSETEKAIQNSIDALKGQYTIFIVAHRLSTIKNADRVVLMNKGRIEQTGTFKDLVQKNSVFRKMVELQEV